MEKIGYTRNSKGATGKQAVPRCWLKEVTAIFVRDGRLLLFAVTDLDFFSFAVYTTDKGSATGKRARSPELLTRSNRWFAVPGGYFFLPLQTLMTRPMTVTMRLSGLIVEHDIV